jgi:hypothetical protein
MSDERRKALLFSKKVTKKLLLGGRCIFVPITPNRRLGLIGTAVIRPQEQKFFGSFFQKRTSFLRLHSSQRCSSGRPGQKDSRVRGNDDGGNVVTRDRMAWRR